jgi:hypothetical protein
MTADTQPGDQHTPPAKAYLAIPTYDGRIHEGVMAAVIAALRHPGANLYNLHVQSGSWLTKNFNIAYSGALNARREGVTHFVMLHDDVLPLAPDWLQRMLAISAEVGAGILSAVIPLKSGAGLTSTAIDEAVGAADPRFRVRRLTMTEAKAKPETFTDPRLLLNTGLMVVDIRQREAPWADGLWFEFEDRIVRGGDGRFHAVGFPEDWQFSRKAREAGASLWATTAVPVKHMGGGQWPNTSAWGAQATDA